MRDRRVQGRTGEVGGSMNHSKDQRRADRPSRVVSPWEELPGPDPLPTLRLDSTEAISGAWLDRFPRRSPSRPARLGVPTAVPQASLLCVCPECGSPMSIRVWLRLADCWSCGTSLELTALAAAGKAVERPGSDTDGRRATAVPTASPRAAAEARRVARQPERVRPRPVPPVPRRRVPVPPPSPRTAWPSVRSMTRDWRDWLLTAPAWLISLLLHLVLLTLLGLLNIPSEPPITGITLSTAVSPRVRQGARVQVEQTDEPQFDLPFPERDQPEDEARRKALVLADQDARQLRQDLAASEPRIPLPEIRRMIGAEDLQRTFAVRDPRVRVELVRREGGTTWTEAAVARGLRWMAEHQRPDGSWSLDRFSHAADCRGRCDGTGHVRSDSAATSLCLLPFLGAGQTHQQGIYQDVVAQGLHWLIAHQDADGDLRIDSQRNAGMYAHGQGAIVLCEAYAMTGDEQLRGPAQAAIDFIVAAQHRAGGWRYGPGEDGDTSVLGWQLMALQSARVAGLRVPQNTWRRAERYLNRALTADGVSYAYRPGEGPSHVMTAEALLCRMYMGHLLEDPALRAGLDQLVRQHPPTPHEPNVYYWYYATQALHHAGGAVWEQWNLQLRDVLVQTQRTNGHTAGSWDPRGPHADAGGRLYMTALAVCTLEVYYRHAPIFRRITL